MERYIPWYIDPANIFVPDTAMAFIFTSTRPVSAQLLPLLVEIKTPPFVAEVPANISVPETDRVQTKGLVSPVLTVVQLVPLSEERKTPPPKVPTKIFEPETAIERICIEVSWEPTSVQVVPLLVERNKPYLVPANRSVPLAAKQVTSPPLGPLDCVHWASAPCMFNSRIIHAISAIRSVFISFIYLKINYLKKKEAIPNGLPPSKF